MGSSTKESLQSGLNHIDDLADGLELSESTVERSVELYTQIIKNDDFKMVGRGVKAVVSGTVLIASRQTGDIRTAQEIASLCPSHVTEKSVLNSSKFVCQSLDIGPVLIDPETYIEQISNQIRMRNDDVVIAKDIIASLKRHNAHVGKGGKSLAATAVYLAGALEPGHGRYQQTSVADAAGVSALTIRNNYSEYAKIVAGDPDFPHEVPRVQDD